MLASAAARAVSGRGAPSTFRIAGSICPQHAYSTDSKTSEARRNETKPEDLQLEASSQDGSSPEVDHHSQGTQPLFKKGPYRRNRIWGPNMRIGLSHHQQIQSSKSQASFSSLVQRRSFASKSWKPPKPKRSEDAAPNANRSEASRNEQESPQDFHSKLRERSEAQKAEGEVPGEAPGTGQASGPLPDLRQGIPSSFNADTSNITSSFKDKDAESPSLNLTADPATSGGRNDNDGPREEYVSSIEQRRNAIAQYMFLAAGMTIVGGTLYLGRNWDDQFEANAHPDVPNGYSPFSIYNRIMERLRNLFGYYTEPAFEKLLPDPSPDPTLRAPYTLVLSLEDLLVSSKWDRSNGYTVAKRPGVDYFLRYMSQYYELVIFTTVQPMNADGVLRKLDPFRFCIPLFRDATRYMEGEHVKDLSYLNRDLSKTLIIDTVPAHVKLQPENAIVLPKWKGDIKDPSRGDLVALIPFLEYIASMSIDDVRKVLKSYEGTHIPTEFHRRESLAREQFNKRLEEEKSKRPRFGSGLGGLSSALGFKPNQGMMVVPGEQTPAEGFAEGKMLSDQMRERGQRAYQEMEKQLQENGETWLKQQEEEEKKMQEEATKNMTGWLPFFGRAPPGGESEPTK